MDGHLPHEESLLDITAWSSSLIWGITPGSNQVTPVLRNQSWQAEGTFTMILTGKGFIFLALLSLSEITESTSDIFL